jgi:hypothetical protein
MKNKTVLSTAFLVVLAFGFSQCKKTTETDKQLFNKANQTGFTYYKGDSSFLASSSPSAHNAFFRVRFNPTAQAALTDTGKLPIGGAFPEGSVIVKELYNTANGSLQLLAVMEKAPGNSAAGNGWLWGEYETDGKAVFSTSKKGDGCTSCHNDAGNRDYVRLFELFP